MVCHRTAEHCDPVPTSVSPRVGFASVPSDRAARVVGKGFPAIELLVLLVKGSQRSSYSCCW